MKKQWEAPQLTQYDDADAILKGFLIPHAGIIEIKHGNRLCVCAEPGGEWIEVGRVEMIVTQRHAATPAAHIVLSMPAIVLTMPVCELVLLLAKARALKYQS